MAQGYPCPTCPEDCGTLELPVFVSDYCTDSVVLEASEIKEILFAAIDPEDETLPVGGPTDWTSKADWNAVVSNTGISKVRRLFGVGDVPDPEAKTIVLHDNLKKILEYLYKLNFDLLSMHQDNYDAMRVLQCGGTFKLWFITRGDYMYGGQNGITVNVIAPTSPNGRGPESNKIIKLFFEWSAKCDPDRIPNPFKAPVLPG